MKTPEQWCAMLLDETSNSGLREELRRLFAACQRDAVEECARLVDSVLPGSQLVLAVRALLPRPDEKGKP